MGVRRTSKPGLVRRMAALEVRVTRLEGLPARSGPRRPPGAVVGPTCPGCSLTLPSRRTAARCVWCGFRLDAVAPR